MNEVFRPTSVFVRMLKNAGWLFSGNSFAAVIGLINLALTARILGVEIFGVFVLITTYVAIIDRLINFQIFHAIIRYGTHALEAGEKERFGRIIKFCISLDIGGAIAGAVVGMALAGIVAGYLRFSQEHAQYLFLFSLVVAVHLSGVPTGILRLYNHYRVLALQGVIAACTVFLCLPIVWFLGGGLGSVLLVYALSQVVGVVFLIVAGGVVLHRHGVLGFLKEPIRGVRAENTGILRFIIYANIEGAVKVLRQLDVFLINYLLSAEAVGIYRIARKLADTLSLAIDPFFHAIYPELNRLYIAKNRFGFERLMLQSGALIGVGSIGALLAFLALGGGFIEVVFGSGFAQAYPVAIICIVAMIVWAVAQPLAPAL